ncbi:MAG: hypothetical protein RLZ98_1544 [Pseudomonadota bacterium]|jgi:hypothetical protein
MSHDHELDAEQMQALLQQLEGEDEADRLSLLASDEDFEMWALGHPSLRHMFMVENIKDVIPAIMNFLRAMFGFGPGGSGDSQKVDGSGN